MPTSFSSLACIDLTTQNEALIQEQCNADGFLLVDGAENLQLPTRHSIHYSVLTTRTVYCTCSRCLPSWNILNFSLNFNFETLLRRSHRLWMAPLPAQQTDLTSVQQKPLPCTRRPCPCRSCQAQAACSPAPMQRGRPLRAIARGFTAIHGVLTKPPGRNGWIHCVHCRRNRDRIQCEFWGRGRDRGRASEALAQEIQKKAKAECCTGDSEKGGSSALHN